MGEYAEYTAEKAKDDLAGSGRVCLEQPSQGGAAQESCKFSGRSCRSRFSGKGRRYPCHRGRVALKDTDARSLSPSLKPSFRKDGTVTAGNAPGLNDAASALVVTSLAFAKAYGPGRWPARHPIRHRWRRAQRSFFAPIVAVQNLLSSPAARSTTTISSKPTRRSRCEALADGRALGWD